MGLESGSYISDLVSTNPPGTDDRATADDHLRLIKAILKTTFPSINGAVTTTPAELNILDGATVTTTELNYVSGVTSAIQTQLNAKAAVASPTFTGTPAAPTASVGTSTTQLATTAFVDAEMEAFRVKDWGTLSVSTQIDLEDAELHIIEVSSNITLTIASANTNDKATLAIHNTGGYTITLSGIDNDSPTLTVDTNVQDFLGIIKSHGKISCVATNLNHSAV